MCRENATEPTLATLSSDDFLRNVRGLNAAVESLQREAQRLKAAYYRHQNAVIRLRTLSAETFTHILYCCLRHLESNSRTLRNLAQGCTHWRDVILTTPALWSVVKYGGHTSVTMRKAQDSPLTIVHAGYYMNNAETLQDLVGRTGPPAQRWKHVSWSGTAGQGNRHVIEPILVRPAYLAKLAACIRWAG